MKKKILGIDVGVTSVGWGIVDEDYQVVDSGVRLFDELSKDKNANRRGFRSQRRMKRRKNNRMSDMRKLLVEHELIADVNFIASKNPYLLRKKGLTEKLTNEELATILTFYAKRRGSTLDVVEEEEGKSDLSPKKILNDSIKELAEKGFIVDVQLARLKEKGQIRGSMNMFTTKDYLKEIEEILKNQKLSEEFNKKVISILTRKREFFEGPGSPASPSDYGTYREVRERELLELLEPLFSNGKETHISYENREFILNNEKIIEKVNLIELMRGKCSIYPDQLRSPRHAYSAELHNLLNDLNNITVVVGNRKLTTAEKELIVNEITNSGRKTPGQALKLIGLSVKEVTGFRINEKEKGILTEFKVYTDFLKLKLSFDITNSPEVHDQIADVLTKNKSIEEREKELSSFLSNKKDISKIAQLPGYTEYHSLSLKAILQLNKEMLVTEMNQMQIITNKGLGTRKKRSKLVLDEKAILSPVAKRAHRQALIVIQSLTAKYGEFDRIVIETTRSKNTADEIRNINDYQSFRKKRRDKVEELVKGKGINFDNLNATLIHKIELYQEQNGKCIYTGIPIVLNELINDPQAYQIDHVLPYSKTLNNRQNNKALSISGVNHKKGIRTPFEYFQAGDLYGGSQIKSFFEFEQIVLNNSNLSNAKRINLLYQDDLNKYDVLQKFIERNLIDTSYASKSLITTLNEYFRDNGITTAVAAIRGSSTSMFRGIATGDWYRQNRNSEETNPFIKDREQYRHHAIDALIVAGLSNQEMFRKLYAIGYDKESDILSHKRTGVVIDDPLEDPNLRKFLQSVGKLTDDEIKFSWKIDTKVNRSFADQTIYSTRNYNEEEYVIRKYNDIYALKKLVLKKVFDDKKLLAYRHDLKTYQNLEAIYEQYKEESLPFQAYKNAHGPIRKYSKKGDGPKIKSLKYQGNRLGNHLEISKNYNSVKKSVVLLQISPYRTDIYQDPNGNYRFVTIRYSDILKDKKGRYVDESKYEEKLKDKGITNRNHFILSLYRNNLVYLDSGLHKGLYKFIATNNDSSNQIDLRKVREVSKQIMPAIGRNTKQITKYNVSIIGEYTKVIKEELTLVR